MPRNPERPTNEQLFSLGRIVATPGALEALQRIQEDPHDYILRHVRGDWSQMDPHDQEENRRSVQEGHRIFSSFALKDGAKLWVVTEWDRSVTTLLTPIEY